MAHADIHVLGSVSGYGTLAGSPGVSADERLELETLSFGDATSAEARARLASQAVMTGRRLRSGRFAISRMLAGGTDDAGRPTVEVVSLVMDGRAYRLAIRSLQVLAAELAFWTRARASTASGIPVPDRPVVDGPPDAAVLRILELWHAARRDEAQAVLPESENATLLRMLAQLEPPELEACRWGVGLLSLSAPADLLTVAPGTNLVGIRPILRLPSSGRGRLPVRDDLAAGRDEIVAGSGAPERWAPMRLWSSGAAIVGTLALVIAVILSSDRPKPQGPVGDGLALPDGSAAKSAVGPVASEAEGGTYGRNLGAEAGLPAPPGQPRDPAVIVLDGSDLASTPAEGGERDSSSRGVAGDPVPAVAPPSPSTAGGDSGLGLVPGERVDSGPPCEVRSFEEAVARTADLVEELKEPRRSPDEHGILVDRALCTLVESTNRLAERMQSAYERLEELRRDAMNRSADHQRSIEDRFDLALRAALKREADRASAAFEEARDAFTRGDADLEKLRASCMEIANRLAKEGDRLGTVPDLAIGDACAAINELRQRLDADTPRIRTDSHRDAGDQVHALWEQLRRLKQDRQDVAKGLKPK